MELDGKEELVVLRDFRCTRISSRSCIIDFQRIAPDEVVDDACAAALLGRRTQPGR